MRTPLLLILLPALLVVAGLASAFDARHFADRRRQEELLYYPSGPAVRRAALGHTSSMADLAWLRAIQYYGEHKKGDRKFDMMGHIFEIITDLDPRFENAYIFGGLVTAEDAGDPVRGVRLMEKGVRNNPESWRLAFETGFVSYVTGDHAGAARHFQRAVGLPGAPEKAMRFAAFAAGRAGDRTAAASLWKLFAGTTTNSEMREKAMKAIKRLEAEAAR